MTTVVLLLVAALVVGALALSRRARTVPRLHPSVDRTRIARTATHVTTSTPPDVLLEAVVTDLLAHRAAGRPPRRYAVARRDARSVELAQRLVERPELGPVLTLLVEADPAGGGGTSARLEFLDVMATDGVVDRLAELTRTRDAVLGTVTRLDPGARFDDELLALADDAGRAEDDGAAV